MSTTIKVWDPLVRVLHWLLAGCFLAAFLVEEGDTAHEWLGYATLGLVAIRMVWGFVGSRHARFVDWV
ncbi:MAG: cytochrome b/b6 domain-containing protein, partial [Lysobacter sp.]